MIRVLDTNAALYLLQGKLAEPLEDAEYAVSVITELELLCFPDITEEEETLIKRFLADVKVVGITDDVKDSAIRLRRRHKLPLPDAIICATAFVLDAVLVTNDAKVAKVVDVNCIGLELRNG